MPTTARQSPEVEAPGVQSPRGNLFFWNDFIIGLFNGKAHLLAPPDAGPTHPYALGLSILCMVSQLTKALNQPVLVVSLGYMPKP